MSSDSNKKLPDNCRQPKIWTTVKKNFSRKPHPNSYKSFLVVSETDIIPEFWTMLSGVARPLQIFLRCVMGVHTNKNDTFFLLSVICVIPLH